MLLHYPTSLHAGLQAHTCRHVQMHVLLLSFIKIYHCCFTEFTNFMKKMWIGSLWNLQPFDDNLEQFEASVCPGLLEMSYKSSLWLVIYFYIIVSQWCCYFCFKSNADSTPVLFLNKWHIGRRSLNTTSGGGSSFDNGICLPVWLSYLVWQPIFNHCDDQKLICS